MRLAAHGDFNFSRRRGSGFGTEHQPTLARQIFRPEQERYSCHIALAARNADQRILGGIAANQRGFITGTELLRRGIEIGAQVNGRELAATDRRCLLRRRMGSTSARRSHQSDRRRPSAHSRQEFPPRKSVPCCWCFLPPHRNHLHRDAENLLPQSRIVKWERR